MNNAGVAVLSLMIFGTCCFAQIMNPSEYREYLKRLDVQAEHWQDQIGAINIEKIKVDYSVGKQLAQAQQIASKNIAFVRNSVRLQHSHDSLTNDIQIENSLTDANSMLNVLDDLMPENGEGVYWARTLTPLMKEIGEVDFQLRKHVAAHADLVEAKADKCSW